MNQSKKNDPRFWALWIRCGAVKTAPAPCDQDIFHKGEPIALLDGRSNAVEKWVQKVAKKTKSRVDWHYSGGVAQVLHFGDLESRQRVEQAIINMPEINDVRVIQRLPIGSSGLYRKDVTEVPKGATAGFMDPVSGKQVYI